MCYIVLDWGITVIMNSCKFRELREKGSVIMCMNVSGYGDCGWSVMDENSVD